MSRFIGSKQARSIEGGPCRRRTSNITDISHIALIVGTIFCASLIHATFGFGTALVAMPVLALIVGVKLATPLVGLVVVTTIVCLLFRTRQHVDVRSATHLLLASLPGIVAGIFAVQLIDDMVIKRILGVFLIAFSLSSLIRAKLPSLVRWEWVVPFGFLAGFLGGAFNTNAPAVVMYGALKRWPADQFRATLQGYFLPAALIICSAHAIAGFWTLEVFKLYLVSVPAIVIATILGSKLNRQIPGEKFTRVLYSCLIVLGLMQFL